MDFSLWEERNGMVLAIKYLFASGQLADSLMFPSCFCQLLPPRIMDSGERRSPKSEMRFAVYCTRVYWTWCWRVSSQVGCSDAVLWFCKLFISLCFGLGFVGAPVKRCRRVAKIMEIEQYFGSFSMLCEPFYTLTDPEAANRGATEWMLRSEEIGIEL